MQTFPNSAKPSDVLAAMPATDFTGVLGRTQFDPKGDLKVPVISLYGYAAGRQKLLDFMKM